MATDTLLPTTPLIVPLDISTASLAEAEAVDVEVGERFEHVDVGPIVNFACLLEDFVPTYLRVRAEDLMAWTDEVRHLLGRIDDAVLEAREHKALADSHECPGCRTRLAPDDLTCGAARCERIFAQELNL